MLCAITVALRSVPRWGRGAVEPAPDGRDTGTVAAIVGGILGRRLDDALPFGAGLRPTGPVFSAVPHDLVQAEKT